MLILLDQNLFFLQLAFFLRRSWGRNPWVFISPDHKGPRRKLWMALVDPEPSKTDEIIGSRCFFLPTQVGKNSQELTTSLICLYLFLVTTPSWGLFLLHVGWYLHILRRFFYLPVDELGPMRWLCILRFWRAPLFAGILALPAWLSGRLRWVPKNGGSKAFFFLGKKTWHWAG